MQGRVCIIPPVEHGVAMRANRYLKTLFALIAGACMLHGAGSTANAATVLRMELPALVAASDLVIRGIVASGSCRVGETGRIFTDTVVHIDELLVGEAGSDTLVVTTLGGEIGDRGQRVPGSPQLLAGDEVVLFLQRPGAHSPLARTFVVGLSQGVFHVTRSSGQPILTRHMDGLVLTGWDAVPIPDDLDTLRQAIKAFVPTAVQPDVEVGR